MESPPILHVFVLSHSQEFTKTIEFEQWRVPNFTIQNVVVDSSLSAELRRLNINVTFFTFTFTFTFICQK